MIIYDYFSSIFCIVPKKLLLKYRKWVSYLKNRYHYVQVVENARINFSVSPYCTLFFSRKEKFKFFKVALSVLHCNGAVGCIMKVWGYQHWNTANTTLDIYLLSENGHKSTQTRCKIDFRLTSISLPFTRYFSVTIHTLKRQMLAQNSPWTFCQNNTVMLTCTHNHAPGILLW